MGLNREKTYSSGEIESNILRLHNLIESMKRDRQRINKDIRDANKKLEYWKSIDPNQYKMF